MRQLQSISTSLVHQHKYTAALRRSVSKLDIKGDRESELESKGKSGVERNSGEESESEGKSVQ